MNPDPIARMHGQLLHAVTQFDARASKGRFYNPNALGIYFERVEEVMSDINAGANPRTAVIAGFSDRLLTACLKAIGEPDFTRDELGSAVVYEPVAKATGGEK